MKEIEISDLSLIFQKIVKKLLFENPEGKIIIDTDFYKYVPSDEWDNLNEDIIELGSFFDDIENLKLLVKNSNRPCTYVDFDRLASLLRVISQEKNPPI